MRIAINVHGETASAKAKTKYKGGKMTVFGFHRLPIVSKLILAAASAALLFSGTAKAADDAALGSSEASTKKDGEARSKLSSRLSTRYEEYKRQQLQDQATSSGRAAPLIPMDGDTVVIDAAAAGDVEDLIRDLKDLGATNISRFGRVVSAILPLNAIPELERLTSLNFARPAMARRNKGSVTSEGDEAINANLAREEFRMQGRGTVGTLSDSFDCLDGAAGDTASGDLSPKHPVLILDDNACDQLVIDEGRAMIQIIRDLAPRARQAFHTAFNGQADFANGIKELATEARADVIVDDISYLDEPFFQDGIIAQAVDEVRDMGVAYFTAAGNDGRNSWESGDQGFVSSGVTGVSGLRHDFDPGPDVDGLQTVRLGTGETTFSFQWDEPFFSVSGAPGSASDLDFVVYHLDGTEFGQEGGSDFNTGNDPVEVVTVFNDGPPVEVAIAIELFDGPPPGLMKYIVFTSFFDPTEVIEFPTQSSTIFGHANADGAGSVGSADWLKTPPFGVSPPEIEPDSTAGGTPILFDKEGERIEPIVRPKPNFVGPDGVSTTFAEFTGLSPFFGTSAAAPHAAAVGALMLDANRTLEPNDIFAILGNTAIDMDDPETPDFDEGFDFGTGFGLIDALGAVGAALGPNSANRVAVSAVQ
jgi:hypothetical protein